MLGGSGTAGEQTRSPALMGRALSWAQAAVKNIGIKIKTKTEMQVRGSKCFGENSSTVRKSARQEWGAALDEDQ